MASKDKAFYSKKTLNINGKVLDLASPKIMGILNITDDSFFDGGKYEHKTAIQNRVEKMIVEGADIIDVGGYSSRPGAKDIDQEQEFERVNKGIKIIREVSTTIPISVDTFHSEVAKKSLDLGANIINDISGGDLDNKMFDVVADYNAPYIMMHMVGSPKNMMDYTQYDDLLNDILNYFIKKINHLTQIGIKDVIIDVGFGFSKNVAQNHELLHHLKLFQILNVPLLVGISRKSMIYKVLETSPEQALNGTTVLNTIALMNGASMLRVHDVKEVKELINLVKFNSN